MLLDVQLKAFQACVTTMMDSTNTRIDTFVKVMTRELTELKTSVQFSQTELHEMRDNYKTENDKERYDHRSLQKLTSDFRRMDDTIAYMENQSRRNNLRIDGVVPIVSIYSAIQRVPHDFFHISINPVRDVATVRCTIRLMSSTSSFPMHPPL